MIKPSFKVAMLEALDKAEERGWHRPMEQL
jgi:hypothetical protein